MALGKQIKRYRELLGWTLESLSEKSRVDVGTISAMENRDSQRSKYAAPLAKALGLTLDQLLDESTTYTPNFGGGNRVVSEVAPQTGQSKPSTMAEALQTIEQLIQQIQSEVAAQGARVGGVHHIEHAWPFGSIKREQWEALTPQQKTAVEGIIQSMLATQHSTIGSTADKRHVTG
ncbi:MULTISPECIES: helix-turn-helix domain-containing protein [Giesbergeria]|uniref:Helix-turn-helix domain-containing protein n=1 Tax=Giesbergeria sinuosa TaxID=80883 RepID=A0ABV9QD83_9BURK